MQWITGSGIQREAGEMGIFAAIGHEKIELVPEDLSFYNILLANYNIVMPPDIALKRWIS